MAGANVPIDGFMENAGRDEGEMKAALEDLTEVLRRAPGVDGQDILTIAAGSITPNGAGTIYLIGQGGDGIDDDLTNIAQTNTTDGTMLVLLLNTSAEITVKHQAGGGGALWTQDTADFIMKGSMVSIWSQSGAQWIELLRTYAGELAAFRAYLGLGTAATRNEGTGNLLDADKVDGLEAAAFLLAGAQAVDADKLDGIEGVNYARLDVAAKQDFNGAIEARTVMNIDAASGVSAALDLRENGVRRGQLFWDASNERVVLRSYDVDGVTPYAELHLPGDSGNPDQMQYLDPSDATLYSVLTAKGGNAKTIIGVAQAGVTTEVGLTGMIGVTFPQAPDGVLAFRVTVVATFNGPVDAFVSISLRMGTLGTLGDPLKYVRGGQLDHEETNRIFSLIYYHDEELGSTFLREPIGHAIIVPAANEKLTVTVAAQFSSAIRAHEEASSPYLSQTYLLIEGLGAPV